MDLKILAWHGSSDSFSGSMSSMYIYVPMKSMNQFLRNTGLSSHWHLGAGLGLQVLRLRLREQLAKKIRSTPGKKAPESILKLPFNPMKSHRIHGAAIYGNMDPINIPPLC